MAVDELIANAAFVTKHSLLLTKKSLTPQAARSLSRLRDLCKTDCCGKM
jgi:hypothetical protein